MAINKRNKLEVDKRGQVKVYLDDVRLSFAYIFSTKKGDDDKEKYGTHLLMDKTTELGKEQILYLKKAIALVESENFKGKKVLDEKKCLRNGNDKVDDWKGYENQYFVSTSSPNPVMVIDRKGDEIDASRNAKEKLIYSGCYCNAIIKIWPQDHPKYGRRVNASLEALQFLRHGEPLSEGAIKKDDFDYADDDVEDFEDDFEEDFGDDDIL